MYCVGVVVVPTAGCDGESAGLISVIFPDKLVACKKKHCVCELGFYSAFNLVPWYVLIVSLCMIVECALLLLPRIFEVICVRAVR